MLPASAQIFEGLRCGRTHQFRYQLRCSRVRRIVEVAQSVFVHIQVNLFRPLPPISGVRMIDAEPIPRLPLDHNSLSLTIVYAASWVTCGEIFFAMLVTEPLVIETDCRRFHALEDAAD